MSYFTSLELNKVLLMLSQQASCRRSAELLRDLIPQTEYEFAKMQLDNTASLYSAACVHGTPTLGDMPDIQGIISRAVAGGVLSIEELLCVEKVVKCIDIFITWHKTCEQEVLSSGLFLMLISQAHIANEIDRCIFDESKLKDSASHELMEIRAKIRRAEGSIREQLDSIVRSKHYSKVLQDSIVTMRDGRFVVPVKSENRGDLEGIVHGSSASGATVFVEPAAVVDSNNKIKLLQIEEQKEQERILSALTALVAKEAKALEQSIDILIELDMLFAKVRLAQQMDANVPILTDTMKLSLIKARHPLIPRDRVVPINIELGDGYDTLVITGPNTGGKTVALKTVGLLASMVACGMLVPCDSSSVLPVYSQILVDIGDEQSIEQSLSTFSAHIKSIIEIVSKTDSRSLVLLDELGAGTDPVEGAALAVAIVEQLRKQAAGVIATTHYAEMKVYALGTQGVENGSFEFDLTTLSPTYRLIVGVPGKSNAFAIATRLGLSERVIDRATELVSGESLRFEQVVDALEQTRTELEQSKKQAEQAKTEAEQLRKKLESETEGAKAEYTRLLQGAREKAKYIVDRATEESSKLLSELEQLKKEQSKEILASGVNEARRGYKSRIKQLNELADPVEQNTIKGYVLPRKLKSSDTVLIVDIDTKGQVISGPDSSDYYMIQAGIIKTKVHSSNLKLLENEPKLTHAGVKIDTRKVRRAASAKATTELDIRGYMVDEGIMCLDSFIDRCILNGVSVIRIIHGKGTGALRLAVQSYLAGNRCVISYRDGAFGEGDLGVTVAQLS